MLCKIVLGSEMAELNEAHALFLLYIINCSRKHCFTDRCKK